MVNGCAFLSISSTQTWTMADTLEMEFEAIEVSTAHSSLYSDYSEPASEADVDIKGKLILYISSFTYSHFAEDSNELDLVYSEYSLPPSEASVEVLLYSEYSLPASETDVDMDMLYPQAYIQQLYDPDREECDTPAPPKMLKKGMDA